MLKPGSTAPNVVLLDQHGHRFHLAELQGKRTVVLYFYPKDNTRVCTLESCKFRDLHAQFTALGAMVIGISAGSPASHRAFAERHHLPFLLLSDPDDAAYRAFGLKHFLGLKQRATFVIDKEGVIRAAISNRLLASKHVRGAWAALRDQGLNRS